MKKRGLSNIIVTLLLVLLVFAAVSIVWGVTRGIIESGVDEIELGKFTLDLEIKSVKIEGDDVTVNVIVKRNPGPGEFIGMNFVFSDGQNSEVIREDTVLNELEERSFTYTLTKISTSKLEEVSIAPIYELKSGKENMGNIADKFDVVQGSGLGTGTGEIVKELSNFEKLGYSGAGKVEYGPFSSDIPKLPEFRKAIVDPLDVLPGDNQTFTVHVYSPNSVINVTSMTELDNSTLNLNFEKISEYEENGETIEIWSVSWIVNDVHTTTYRTAITARDSSGNENTIELTWTDSCQSIINHGGDVTLSQSCTSTTVDGLDGGSLTIASGVTLTIGSGTTWGFNSGKTITVDGTITVNGQIKKGNLYYTDADGDGYAPNSDLSFGSGDKRASSGNILGFSDCKDTGSGAVYVSTTSTTTASDNDNDGYTDTSGANNCRGTLASTITGRTYYRDTSGGFSWLIDSQRLGTNDCVDTNAHIFQNVGSLGSDNDQDGYIDNMVSTCVGSTAAVNGRLYYRDAAGNFAWLHPFFILGDDCDDSDPALLDAMWGSPVQSGTCCFCFGSQKSGACPTVGATNLYGTGFVDICGKFGELETLQNKNTQICNMC